MVVKFSNVENKTRAETELSSEIKDSNFIKISEPVKILPKMAIVNVPKNLDDEYILETIKNKNQVIADLVKVRDELSIVAKINSPKNSLYKTVIIKVSGNIRKYIISQNSYLYVDLVRCKVFDNIWVRRCYHCQEYGHNANSCHKKEEHAICGFCAKEHTSRDCPNRDNIKCINCVRAGKTNVNHYVTDKDCPIMNYHKDLIVNNTDYMCSKNELDWK